MKTPLGKKLLVKIYLGSLWTCSLQNFDHRPHPAIDDVDTEQHKLWSKVSS